MRNSALHCAEESAAIFLRLQHGVVFLLPTVAEPSVPCVRVASDEGLRGLHAHNVVEYFWRFVSLLSPIPLSERTCVPCSCCQNRSRGARIVESVTPTVDATNSVTEQVEEDNIELSFVHRRMILRGYVLELLTGLITCG